MINCPSCGEENPPKFRLCGYCGTPLAAAAPALPAHEVRKTVTIVFCDLKDSTALGERVDAEALHEIKERYFGAMAAEITRHGGKIEKYIGDAIMAVFGLPRAHEDDALRAVRAAAGMRSALAKVNEELLARYGVALANRTGVNTGEVVANADAGADQKLATGDAVNVAARLEQAAPVGQIYLGELTYRLVRDAVDVEAVEPLEVKGKAQRLTAYRLVAALGLDGHVRRHDTPLVGRDAELALLEAAYREACETSAPRLVTVIGDAGAGKSRLTAEFVDRRARQGACPARALPAVRRRHHVLAAARHRRRGGRNPRRRRARRGARQAARCRRRRRRRRSPGRRGGPEHGGVPVARDELGGAQIPRAPRGQVAGGRVHRRHPLGRDGVPRPARTCARHRQRRADRAACHRAPRPARGAPAVVGACGREPPRARAA